MSFSKVTGTAKITLKDGNGDIIHDDSNLNIACKKSLGTSEIPKSTSKVKASEISLNTEKLKKLWNDLQGKKSNISEGTLNLPMEPRELNSNPFG